MKIVRIAIVASLVLLVSTFAGATTIALGTCNATGDLTTNNACSLLNGAYFQQSHDQSTGTGVIEPFVRIQASGFEQGYNTGAANPLNWDAKAGTWTHALLLTDVPTVTLTVNGVPVAGTFYQFLLDINQTNANPLITLDQIKLWLGATGTYNANALPGSLAWDLDSNGDQKLTLNYDLNAGSGSGDMFMYIPTSYFSGNNPYLYLYSQFGCGTGAQHGCSTGYFASNDGFEEWAVLANTTPPPPAVPEPSSLLLLGSGLTGLAGLLKRKLS